MTDPTQRSGICLAENEATGELYYLSRATDSWSSEGYKLFIGNSTGNSTTLRQQDESEDEGPLRYRNGRIEFRLTDNLVFTVFVPLQGINDEGPMRNARVEPDDGFIVPLTILALEDYVVTEYGERVMVTKRR